LVDTERFDLSFPLWLMALFARSLPVGDSTLLSQP
jgi:hypothetical protein